MLINKIFEFEFESFIFTLGNISTLFIILIQFIISKFVVLSTNTLAKHSFIGHTISNLKYLNHEIVFKILF